MNPESKTEKTGAEDVKERIESLLTDARTFETLSNFSPEKIDLELLINFSIKYKYLISVIQEYSGITEADREMGKIVYFDFPNEDLTFITKIVKEKLIPVLENFIDDGLKKYEDEKDKTLTKKIGVEMKKSSELLHDLENSVRFAEIYAIGK